MSALDSSVIRFEASLGSNYEIKFQDKNLGVIKRYWKQETLAEILPNERVSFCMRRVVPGKSGVKILHSQKHQKAHYGNLMVCGSIWLCPICASKISERRKEELLTGFDNFEGVFVMVTYTLRHNSNERLKVILKKLDNAYKLTTHGRRWQEFKKRYEVVGSVSNLEITHGQNGWHPHKHVVYLLKNVIEFSEFRRDIENIYLHSLQSSGGSGLAGIALRADIVTNHKTMVAQYIAEYDKKPSKDLWGIEAELTKSYVKSSENFWSILDHFILSGDLNSLGLILEYAEAVKGRRSVVFSRGLRNLLKITDKNDLEVAKENQENSIELLLISRMVWKQVINNKMRGELLKIASSGSVEAITEYLSSNLVQSGVLCLDDNKTLFYEN